jgi:16S rRNA (cytosine1402-N4)-methyltransferase
MPDEVLSFLAVRPGLTYVDATVGEGGHARLIQDRGGRVIALDKDPAAVLHARRLLGSDALVLEADFRDLRAALDAAGVGRVDGLLLDLGVRSAHLDEPERGFSYRQDGPLDMRLGTTGPTLAERLAESDEQTIADVIYRYGEERLSRRIARAIVEARSRAPLQRTTELAALVERAYPRRSRGYHPARRTFQALRIWVNDELGALRAVLEQAPGVLAAGGRLVIISFHSLEDRIVKNTLRDSPHWLVLTRKPATASPSEQEANPRSRSAKLRAVERAPLEAAA